MLKKTLLFAGTAIVGTAMLLGTVQAQQSSPATEVPPTLQTVLKRLTALETENRDLKKRIDTLEKESVQSKQTQAVVYGFIDQPQNPSRTHYQISPSFPNTNVAPSPFYQTLPPTERQPLRWDTNGKYDLLIQSPQTTP